MEYGKAYPYLKAFLDASIEAAPNWAKAPAKFVSSLSEQLKSQTREENKQFQKEIESLSEDQLRQIIEEVGFDQKEDIELIAGNVKSIPQILRTLDYRFDKLDEKLDEIISYLQQIPPGSDHREQDRPYIQNIPYTSIGGLFKGRDDELDVLIAQLGDKSQATAITQEPKDSPEVIYGLGGIGKTRLAVEFGWHALEHLGYKAVLFVNCGQELYDEAHTSDPQQAERQNKSAIERLYAEMARLAVPDLLDIPGADAMLPEAACHEVIKELQGRRDWLIVFDNVDGNDICNAMKATLPKLKGGKVIITSRLANWTDDIKPLELKKLSQQASIDYLLQKTKDKRPSADNDIETVKELAEKLDGLPVALEQAAAYIIYESITFDEYLKDFHDIKLEVLGFEAKKLSLADYPEPLLRTWALTEQKLTAHAKAVLTISAFLSADNIPQTLLLNQSNIVLAVSGVLEQTGQEEFDNRLNGHGDSRAVRRALARLHSYSMISRNTSDKTFSIHRLVQEVARARLSASHKELFTQLILTMIHNDCPDHPTAVKSNFSWHKAMDTHISAITAFTKRLWPDISAIPKHVAGPLSTQINNLATFYQNQARFYEAEPLMKRALAIDEASLGKDHPKVATDLYNLAALYQATNRLKEAEPLMKRALAIDEASLGPEHPKVATDLNNLAALYKATNRLKEAEPLMKRVVKIFEKALGENHPNVATALTNLAQLYQATNRLKDAEPLMKRVVEIFLQFTRRTGHPHPHMETAIENYTALLIQMGHTRNDVNNRLKRLAPEMFDKL